MPEHKILETALKSFGLNPSPEQLEQFMTYKRLLLEWNEKMNLTAITEPTEILLKHFADSATIAEYIGDNMLDVGTGAGFPGVVIKILRPHLRLTLLDSLNKRITFLRALTAELKYNEIEFLHARAEDAARTSLRESFDTVTSRAVAALPVLAEYCLPFVKPGGRFIAMKGPAPADEIRLAEDLISVLGGGAVTVKKVDIPFTDIVHNLVIIEKQRHTSERYPRKGKKLGT